MKLETLAKVNYLAMACALAIGSSSAMAAPCSGSSAGGSSTGDVTLSGAESDRCVVSSVNPQQGPAGNTSGFSTEFGSGWTLLTKVDLAGVISPPSASVGGVSFDIGYQQVSGKAGTWSITTDKAATFDLVFAMHASNRSGAFLFDDTATQANVTQNGLWAINWVNNGGGVPDYSNLTLFVRDVAVTPVPEPETWALMLVGIGVLGFVARRRKA